MATDRLCIECLEPLERYEHNRCTRCEEGPRAAFEEPEEREDDGFQIWDETDL